MALITTVAEIRKQLPRLLSSLSDNANLPNIEKAQRKYLQKILGKALISDLETKYEATNLTGLEQELVTLIQLPLSAYAVMDDLAFIQSMITDSGIRTPSTDKMQAAHRWEYNELKNTLQDYAMDGIEQLLDFLYDNKADFGLWIDSNEFKAIDGLLVKTGTDFSKQYPLYQPLYTYWALKPVIEDVEENYFATHLGRDLFTWCKAQDKVEITAEGGLVDVKKLLKKALAFFTIKHACEHYAVRFDTNGFTVLAMGGNLDDNTNTGRTEASPRQIQERKDACDRDGQNYLSKASSYLIGIAKGLFNVDFGSDFATAFDGSPLNTAPVEGPTDRNTNRKIFGL